MSTFREIELQIIYCYIIIFINLTLTLLNITAVSLLTKEI